MEYSAELFYAFIPRLGDANSKVCAPGLWARSVNIMSAQLAIAIVLLRIYTLFNFLFLLPPFSFFLSHYSPLFFHSISPSPR